MRFMPAFPHREARVSEPTPEIVRAYANHMVREFGATLHEQGDPIGFALGLGLRVVGMDPARYATTLADHIFTPFRFGERIEGAWSLWDQVVVLAHECQHVEQWRRRNLLHGFDYITSTARREGIEAECLSVNLELHHWRYGQVESWYPASRAGGLAAYGCSAQDIVVAEKHLRSIAASAKRGLVISRAARVAIHWLEDNALDVREMPHVG